LNPLFDAVSYTVIVRLSAVGFIVAAHEQRSALGVDSGQQNPRGRAYNAEPNDQASRRRTDRTYRLLPPVPQ
jgi:hypothetical protein